MLLNELFEISADPRYLSAAERSRSQAQATQRQYWASPEEKAAARRTELKREKGIAGYSKRHKAAHPEMYPKVKAQPAPKLRDPSTEYSDDYSVWARGRRDTMEQGVAEGSDPIKDVAAIRGAIARMERELQDPNPHIDREAIKKRIAWEKRRLNLYRDVTDKEQGVAEGHTK